MINTDLYTVGPSASGDLDIAEPELATARSIIEENTVELRGEVLHKYEWKYGFEESNAR